MKKTCLLTMLVLFAVAVLAAPPKTDLEIRSLRGPVKSMSNNYSDYSFNENGRITIESYDYDYMAGDVYYVYDEENRLLSMEDEDLWEGVVYAKYYQYDGEGRISQIEEPSDYVSEFSVFSYNDKGHKTWLKVNGEDGEQINATEYVCDKSGNPIKEMHYNGNMELKDFVVREFNKQGYETEVLKYGPDKELLSKTTYKYDKRNREISRVVYKGKTLDFKLDTTYNDRGDTDETAYFDAEKNETNKTKHVYVYDDHDNWIEQVTFENGIKGETIYRTIEYYDE